MALLPTLFKDYYADADLTPASIAKTTFLKNVVKIVDKGSDVTLRPIVLNGSRTMGGSYGAAKTQAGITGKANSGSALAWQVTRGEFITLHYTNEKDIAMSAGKTPDAAWVEARTAEFDAHSSEHALAIEDRLLAVSGGSVGAARWDVDVYAGANGSSPTFSLTFEGNNYGATRYLQVGDRVVLSAGDGTSSGHTQLAGVGNIIEINHQIGYVRISATQGGAAGTPNAAWTDNTTFSVFRENFFTPGVQSNILNSVEDYFPRSSPSGTFNGVARGSNDLLGGMRLSTTESNGRTLSQRILKLCEKIVATGKSAARYKAYFSPADWTLYYDQAASATGGVERFENEYGTMSMHAVTQLGKVEIVALPRKANGSFWLLPTEGADMLELDVSGGKVGRLITTAFDIASPTDARWETTLSTYGSLTCGSPAVYGVGSTL
jgi:hypothetical protein